MKKNILKSILFILILLIILAVLSKIVAPKNNTKKAGLPKKRVMATAILTEPEKTIDVLIAGDSESYSSYIPLETWKKHGFTSYVCGTPAQPLALTCSYIYDALKKQSPKLVILEANAIYRRKSLARPFIEVASKVFPVFQYHDRWKKLKPEDFTNNINYTHRQRNKGYYFTLDIEPAKNRNYMKENKNNTKIPESNKLYVKAIKKSCEGKGCTFMIYSAPSMKNWSDARNKAINEFAKELGVKYVDLNKVNEEIGINWEVDSRDKGDHVNYTGALKVTEYFGDYLKKNFDLPDHRTDEKYKSWDKDYDKYKKEVQEKMSSKN